MPLERYNEKRDFEVTPEPPGKVARNTGALRYVIQKHAASRLHYDFRLELGGVLLSWAVPKGPSLNPGDRRLAVHVEDHPVEYGGFEGIIPHGEYGGGSVVVWDRGNWFPEGDAGADYRRGHLKFRLEGEKLHGGFSLVRMHGRGEADNWLLLKQDDEHVDEDGERLVRDRPESVISRRTVEEVAADPDKMWRSNRGGRKGGEQTLSPAERKANARKPRDPPAAPETASAGLSDEDIARKRVGLPPLAPAARKTTKKTSKAATKTASKATSKAAAGTSTGKAASKATGKSAARSTGKTASKSTSKAAAKSTGNTASKAAGKAASKSTSKTANKSTSRSAGNTASKAAGKTTSKSTGKSAGKAASKAAGKAAGKSTSKAATARTKTASKAPGKTTSKTAGRARTRSAAKKTSTRRAPAADEPGPAVRATRPATPRGATAPLPSQLSPELATLVDAVPTGTDWVHEIKYDGYRLVARLDGDDVRLLTRRGEDWSARFPWLSGALRARISASTAIVDGELVHLGADGVTRFGELQRALSEERHGSLVYFAFDLLHLDGVDLRPLPLERRKEALAGLLPVERKPGRVRLSEHILGLGDPLFKRACRLGLEGVISKRRDAPYRSGRHRDWLKIKCGKRQEMVVGGFTPARSGTREIGSLLLGVYDDAGKLVYSGKVGSGFDFAGAARLRARLEQLRTRDNPFSKVPPGFGRSSFVRPEVVVEISFTDWTSDGRMRHPVFEGLREDKRARDVRREQAVAVEAVEDDEPPKPAKAPPAQPTSRLRKAAPKPPARGGATVEVLGVKISHPDRVLYPADGITKRDIAEYYERTAEWVLPWLVGRPISVVRCPDTIDKPCFFQKHIHHELPPGVRTADLDGEGGDAPFLYIESAQGLVGMTQVGTLELHIWGSTVRRPEDPDRIIIDLDPDAAVPWARVKETALAVRARLADLDLVSFLKTTGGKGLHVVVPLTPGKQDWDQVKAFARGIALEFARAAPDLFTATATRAGRGGKIYMDYLRNYRGSTSVAPYSTRARPGAPVSVPLRWDELAALETSQKYTVKNLAARLSALRSDPWKDLPKTKQFLRAEVLREVVGKTRG